MPTRAFTIALVSVLSACATVPPEPAPSLRRSAEHTATLEPVFGAPSQAGFGSAVFAEQVDRPEDLETAALRCYRHFLGKQWAEASEATWMAAWRRVYVRQRGDDRGIVAELRGIQDREARSSISMLLDGHANPEAAIKGLSAAYDDAAMENIEVYTLGDGAAQSGVLVAGRAQSGAATFLVFLMD